MTSSSLVRTKRFWELTTQYCSKERSVLLVDESLFAVHKGQALTMDDNFLVLENASAIEIVITKGTIKKIFKECQPFFKRYLENGQIIDNEQAMKDLFYVTIGYLLITNENNTILNIHEDIIFDLIETQLSKLIIIPGEDTRIEDKNSFLIKEVLFLQSLLTSNIPKINKSSSLWYLFKKLQLITLDRRLLILDSPSYEFIFFQSALTSAKRHTNNYYSWQFVKGLINTSKVLTGCKFILSSTDTIEAYAKSHLNESAAWDCFIDLITLNMDALRLTLYENGKYSTRIKYELSDERLAVVVPPLTKYLLELNRWLWDNTIAQLVPYENFKKLMLYAYYKWNEKELVRSLVESLSVHVHIFEELHLKKRGLGGIIVQNGWYSINNENVLDLVENEDMIFQQKFKAYLNWLRLEVFFRKVMKIKLYA
ncbi:hypothetical protein WICMUC_000701 [Wickerhamomyces mucosus]|uniref:Uncharacterized protein n=1 Tax=Wickerhamomyces mucosus TaxID=1378264 RepID=A0A9P8PX65_9ASCO|nr:hypothetical protein WICMUC_000701 [Wickerhamomyces mucosus]